MKKENFCIECRHAKHSKIDNGVLACLHPKFLKTDYKNGGTEPESVAEVRGMYVFFGKGFRSFCKYYEPKGDGTKDIKEIAQEMGVRCRT